MSRWSHNVNYCWTSAYIKPNYRKEPVFQWFNKIHYNFADIDTLCHILGEDDS